MDNFEPTISLGLTEESVEQYIHRIQGSYKFNKRQIPACHNAARDVALRMLENVEKHDNPIEAYSKLLERALNDIAKAEEKQKNLEHEIERLRQISVTDDLTGILNRRGFRNELEKAISQASRLNYSGILIMIDLNEFKDINDTHGHKAGDLVLCSVAHLLSQNIRKSDTAARLGGDEFAVILAGTDLEAGAEKANKIDQILNSHTVSWNGERIYVSASTGIEIFSKNSDINEILHNADMRMYELKRDQKPADLNLVPISKIK